MVPEELSAISSTLTVRDKIVDRGQKASVTARNRRGGEEERSGLTLTEP